MIKALQFCKRIKVSLQDTVRTWGSNQSHASVYRKA